jgi:hypothetical protein
MNTIGKNEGLFNYMSINKLYILDSFLFRIDIFEENDAPTIELHFKLSPNNELLKVRFMGVLEYGFYYKSNYSFYVVERCKFFKKGDVFYVSLDPYDEMEEFNENDQDFILCNEIEGYLS